MRRIELVRPDGVQWEPDQHSGDGVLVLAGSSGRVDSERARVFAAHDCIAQSVRWFGGPGQHDGPWEIPLETFLHQIDALKATCDRIYVVGTSFGSEAALLAGARSPAVSGVVAFAPSDVVWAGFDSSRRERSHWTFGGAPLPYMPFDFQSNVEESPPRFLPLYEGSRATYANRLVSATIPVDLIKNLVLVAGGDDQVWPSVTQAQRIASLRSGCANPTVLVNHPAAGHRTILPGEQFITGGTAMHRGGSESADRALGIDAWNAITHMLDAARSA